MRALPLLLLAAACGPASHAGPHSHGGSEPAPPARAAAPAPVSTAPAGWRLLSTPPEAFTAETDHTVAHDGHASGHLFSRSARPVDYGSLLQTVRAEEYLGKRVRLSAHVRTRGLRREAGLWMRVDGAGSKLAFDNMEMRPIRGDTEWTRREVVLDVPHGGALILLGVWMHGTGDVWIDGVRLEAVGSEVPVTAHPLPAQPDTAAARPRRVFTGLPASPVNLDFEQTG